MMARSALVATDRPTAPVPDPLRAPARLRALEASGLLGDGAEAEGPAAEGPKEVFDRITWLATRLLKVPIAVVSLVEPHRQVLKSTCGLPASHAREMPLSHSVCRYVVESGRPLVVEEACSHPLLHDHPALNALGVAAYMGVPLLAPTGEVLGSLCAVDHTPRCWTEDDVAGLQTLSATLTDELALRASLRRAAEAERARQTTDHQTQVALDAISDLFFIVDLEGRIVRWNRRVREVLGYPDAELATMRAEAFLEPGHHARLREAIRTVIRDGHATIECTVRTRDGQRLAYEIDGRPLYDGEGRLAGVCGTGRDIAERLATERALREGERRFRSFVEATAQVVWHATPDGFVTELSEAWSRFTGQTPEEVSGWGWLDAVHPDDQGWLKPAWQDHLERQVPYTPTYRVRRHDGVYHWFSVRAVPVFAQDGTLHEWIGTCVDVEAHRQAQEALQESELRLRLALDAAQMGTWDVDFAAGTATLSPQALALLGRPERIGEEPLAASLEIRDAFDLIHAADRARVQEKQRAAEQRAIATGEPVDVTDEYRVGPGSARQWIRSVGRIYPGPDGTLLRAIGLVLDITDERTHAALLVRAKEHAEAARAEAEESVRLKSSFLHNMSHEIRTPLTAILGFADLIADEVEPPHREMVETIQHAGRRLLGTLNSVLDLARLESGAAPVSLERLDVAAEAEAALALFDAQARAKGLRLRLDRPQPPVWAATDAGALQRILTNLLSNAVKYTERGHVTLRVQGPTSPEGAVSLTVEDTGVGMDAGFVGAAFEPFRQESEGLGRQHEGSGLGLAIVRQLAHQVEGRIELRTRKGEGSAFTVYLPAAPAAESAPAGETAPPPAA